MSRTDQIAVRQAVVERRLARCLARAADDVRIGLELQREQIRDIRRCQTELAALDAIARAVAEGEGA